MNYTTKDDLSELRIGDTLTLEDGSVHEAIPCDKTSGECNECSIRVNCNDILDLYCGVFRFVFKQIKP